MVKVTLIYEIVTYLLSLILQILILTYLPNKKFETLKTFIQDKNFLKAMKENSANKTIVALLFAISLLILLFSFSKCFGTRGLDHEKCMSIGSVSSKIMNIIFTFISLIVSILVLKKVKKINYPEYIELDEIKEKYSKIKKTEIFSLIFSIVDLNIYVKFMIDNDSQCPNCLTSDNNNYEHKTTTQENIPVSEEKYYIIKKYVPNEIYEAIIKGIFKERAIKHLNQIYSFYKNQKFDGLNNDSNIKNEISNILLAIVTILLFKNDEIMINLSKNIDNNFYILFEYCLPLVLAFIKLKIENGYYKKSYTIIRKIETQYQFFISMEKEIETEDNGDKINYKSVFRCSKVTTETVQILQNGLLKN